MKTIYIAGKISGLNANAVFSKFNNSEVELRAKGYEFINPLELCKDLQNIKSEKEKWKKCMQRCLSTIEQWDGILFHPDWEDSEGAQIEHELGMNLYIPIYYDISQLKDLLYGNE